MVGLGINGKKSVGGGYSYKDFGREFFNKTTKILVTAQLPKSDNRLSFVLLGKGDLAMKDDSIS